MIEKYRKRPIVIEAVEWTGDNYDEIKDFLGKKLVGESMVGEEVITLTIDGDVFDGWSYANRGDMVIKEHDGDCYAMTKEIFRENFDKCYTIDDYHKEFCMEDET